MARVHERTATWSASPDANVVDYYCYVGDAADTDFLSKVDAGSVEDITIVPKAGPLELKFTEGLLPDGHYQLAVCAHDEADNFSDPYQAQVWRDIPLDLTPPAPPSNGGLS